VSIYIGSLCTMYVSLFGIICEWVKGALRPINANRLYTDDMVCEGRIREYMWSVKFPYLARRQPETDTDFWLTTYIPVSYPHKPGNEFIPPKILNSNETLRDSTPRTVQDFVVRWLHSKPWVSRHCDGFVMHVHFNRWCDVVSSSTVFFLAVYGIVWGGNVIDFGNFYWTNLSEVGIRIYTLEKEAGKWFNSVLNVE